MAFNNVEPTLLVKKNNQDLIYKTFNTKQYLPSPISSWPTWFVGKTFVLIKTLKTATMATSSATTIILGIIILLKNIAELI